IEVVIVLFAVVVTADYVNDRAACVEEVEDVVFYGFEGGCSTFTEISIATHVFHKGWTKSIWNAVIFSAKYRVAVIAFRQHFLIQIIRTVQGNIYVNRIVLPVCIWDSTFTI